MLKFIFRISICLVSLHAFTPAGAQDACSSLLTHGIYDNYREQGQASSLSEIRHDICSAYEKYRQDKVAGSVDVSYKVFAAGVSYNSEQIESVGQQMCDLNYSYLAAASLQAKASSVISAVAVQAWQSCVSQYNAGLRVTTDISSEGQVLDLSVYYIPPPGTSTFPNVIDVIVSPEDGMKCVGALASAPQSHEQLNGLAKQLTCSRSLPAAPVTSAAKKYWALPVSLSIHTTAGNIVRRLSAIPVAEEPASPNIGDVLASMLPEAKFRDLHGAGWVLADGREVSGSKYAAVVGPKVPDLRGMFLRGINAGRADAFADPANERPPGGYQEDATALPNAGFRTNEAGSHNHNGRYVGNGPGAHQPGSSGGPAYDSQPIVNDGNHSHAVIGGDSETRPKNAAVFYYIRIE